LRTAALQKDLHLKIRQSRERAAQVSDVRYHSSFVLTPQSSTSSGHERITFALRAARPLLLDFRDGTLSSVEVNGKPVAVKQENGHLELPADRLLAGENTVLAQLTANIAPSGKAITRYEDRDDNTEYLYTLFVPMDASMAFPCFDQPDLKARFQLEVTAPDDWTVISNTAVEGSTTTGAHSTRLRSRKRGPSALTNLPLPPDHFASCPRGTRMGPGCPASMSASPC